MTLPQAEDLLKQIFGDQYEDEQWQLALKIVTETEPDEDINYIYSNVIVLLSRWCILYYHMDYSNLT